MEGGLEVFKPPMGILKGQSPLSFKVKLKDKKNGRGFGGF
jgi:hypothetical protein